MDGIMRGLRAISPKFVADMEMFGRGEDEADGQAGGYQYAGDGEDGVLKHLASQTQQPFRSGWAALPGVASSIVGGLAARKLQANERTRNAGEQAAWGGMMGPKPDWRAAAHQAPMGGAAWKYATNKALKANEPDEYQKRDAAAQRYGIDPRSPEGRTFGLTGKLPSAADDSDYRKREAAARAYGLDPQSPEGRQYVLTNQLPKQHGTELTAIDKRAILEADEAIAANEAAIGGLDEALKLSGTAYDGFGAEWRGWGAAQFGADGGEATMQLDNLITQNALNSLRATFGASPTEGERQILMQIQGSVGQPQAVRDEIYQRAKAAALRRLAFNRARAGEMRSGRYYGEGGGQVPQTPGAPSGQQPGQGQSQAAPAGNGVDPSQAIRDANEAIAKGADPAQVLARLKTMGVEVQ